MMTFSKLCYYLHYFLPTHHYYCMFKLFTYNNLINFEHPFSNLKYITFLIISQTNSCKFLSLLHIWSDKKLSWSFSLLLCTFPYLCFPVYTLFRVPSFHSSSFHHHDYQHLAGLFAHSQVACASTSHLWLLAKLFFDTSLKISTDPGALMFFLNSLT